jgi:Tfp pilus assembly protein PilV
MIPRRGQEGLTLTEVTVVVVLAAVVMTGLIIFYLNAQAVWLDGSAQAITQRELTLTLSTINERARGGALALASGDPHVDLQLDVYDANHDPDSTFSFWLAPDSLIHNGYSQATDISRRDLGAMMHSPVTVFAVRSDANMVYVDSIAALTPQGSRITMSSQVALMNRPNP